MQEGWLGEDYLIIFSEPESDERTLAYELGRFLPDNRLVGLWNWDDFIVQSRSGELWTVPTVPLLDERRVRFELPASISLEPDPRVRGQIKWYLTPLAFGGDAVAESNRTWITHEQHVRFVTWWNDKFREVAAGGSDE